MILVKNGTVFPMISSPIPGGAVLIEDNKIKHVYSSENEIPDNITNVQIIDANGGWILPGLIESHCHIGMTEEGKGDSGDDGNELVNPITPELMAIDGINPMDDAFHNAVQAGITSVMTGPGSSNVVGGQFAFIKTYGNIVDDMVVKFPAAMKIAFGENPKTRYGELDKSPVSRMAIAAMLRQEIGKAKVYQKKKEYYFNKYALHKEKIENEDSEDKDLKDKELEDRDLEDKDLKFNDLTNLDYKNNDRKKENLLKENFEDHFEMDHRYECWLPVLERKIPLKAHVHRACDVMTAIRIAKEFQLGLTLDHCTEGFMIADRLAIEGYPAIVGPNMVFRNKLELEYLQWQTAGILHQAGVQIAITTDHPISLIQYLPLYAGLAVKAGLPMEEGLRAITINAARICNVQDRVGSLKPGMDADLAVFNGNPMETFTKTLYTIIDGKIIYNYENSL